MSFKESLEFALAVSGVAGASSELKRFESEAGKAADKAGDRWEGMGSKMQHVGAGLTLGVTVPLIAGFGMATKAALEDADAQEKLAGALERNTGATKDQVAANEDWIGSQLKAKGFTDDELRPAIERATRSTKDLEEGQKLVSIAMDASVQTGKPLQTVVEALSKAHDGNTTALKKLGIAVKDTEGNALSYDQVLRNLTELTGGAAAEAADTQAGKMKIAKAELGETAETIGTNLLPVIGTLAGGVSKVTEAFDSLSPGMQKVVVYGGLAAAALGPLTTVAGTVAKNFDSIKTAATSGSGMVPALGAAAVGVGVLVTAWEHHESKAREQKDLVEAIGQALKDEAAGSRDAAEATLRDTFEKRGLGEAYHKLLVAVPDLNEQLLSGNDAWKDHAAAVHLSGAELVLFGTEAGKVGDATASARAEAKQHTDDLREEAVAAFNAHSAIGGLAEAHEHAAQATDDAAESGDRFRFVTEAMQKVVGETKALDDAKEATDSYKRSLDAVFGSSLDAEDAAINLRTKITELGTEYGEAAKDGAVTRDEQDKLTLSTNDAFRAASDYVAKLVESGQVADTPIARQEALRFALEQIAQQAPDTQGKVDEYLGKLDKIPANVNTTIDIDTDEAHRKLDEIERRVLSLTLSGGLGTLFGSSAIPRQG